MNTKDLQKLWERAIYDVLGSKIEESALAALSFQTRDSIRRIEIYSIYRKRAELADKVRLPYSYSTNPLILAQRPSISNLSKLWFLYLATYFGKSLGSKWTLFKRAAFLNAEGIICVEEIIKDKDAYFKYLRSFDFFAESQYSNHRKYTKKDLLGEKGFIKSANYFLDNISQFNFSRQTDFDRVYNLALKIPSFGRMAAFDYVCTLCKCGLNVAEPNSMYLKYSTGPQAGFKYLLGICGIDLSEIDDIVQTGTEIQEWFQENTTIFIVAQVLEDAICNWQKSPKHEIRYFG